jgi:DNA-binding MarR family transcriptional regulator
MVADQVTAGDEAAGRGGFEAPPSVAFLVSRLGYEVSGQLSAGLAPLGIEPRDFGLLRAIAQTEGESQRAIGQALNIPPSRMVTLIDDLERRRLVRRRPHPNDRRAHALYLTQAGKRLLGKALEVAIGVEAALCADLAPAERDQLLGLLARLAHSGAAPPGVHPGLATAGQV